MNPRLARPVMTHRLATVRLVMVKDLRGDSKILPDLQRTADRALLEIRDER